MENKDNKKYIQKQQQEDCVECEEILRRSSRSVRGRQENRGEERERDPKWEKG
jgi:hypothetical protein